jgi:hypothetical protein
VSLSNRYFGVFGSFGPVSVSGPVSGRSYFSICERGPCLPPCFIVLGFQGFAVLRSQPLAVSVCLSARLSSGVGRGLGAWQAVKVSNKCSIRDFRTSFRNKCSSGLLALSGRISNRI